MSAPPARASTCGNLVALQPGETVRTMLAVRDLEEESKYIFFATRNGTVKKTELKDFSHVMSRGIIAINIEAGRRTGRRHAHRRPADHLPRLARRPGHPLRRRRRPLHGTQRHRRPRHEPRRQGLHRRHGDDAEAGRARRTHRLSAAQTKAAAKRAPVRRSRRPCPRERLAHSLRHRKRLRQAHARRRIPPDQPRRQGRHQREDDGAQRQSHRHRAGLGRVARSC